MLKTFPIDFVRQILEQKLLEEHIKDVNLFGGKEQVAITSFYEQLKSQDEVDRFVKTYRDLNEQQNRTGLILNGVLLSPENPTITNLYSSLIVPMEWTCSLRCTLENRDNGIITINNLIDKLKGRKVDVAQLNCIDDNGRPYSTPFCVGTIGRNDGEPELKDGDYIGNATNATDSKTIFDNLISSGVKIDKDKEYLLYAKKENKLVVSKCKYNGFGTELGVGDGQPISISTSGNKTTIVFELYMQGSYTEVPTNLICNGWFKLTDGSSNSKTYQDVTSTNISGELSGSNLTLTVTFVVDKPSEWTPTFFDTGLLKVYNIAFNYNVIENDGSYNEIIFPPEHTSFEQYKVSLSFDAIRCDEPRNLNEKEYCELSFGGSATLVSKGVKLGNDLLKIGISKKKILAPTDITFANNLTFLEPLEMPSGSNANTQINQLISNKFLTNTHTDSLALSLQYSFIVDENIPLLEQLFNYARYGTQGITVNDISPNIIYEITEIWCSWGNYSSKTFNAKIVENIDIENTESDTLTININFQIQGENN